MDLTDEDLALMTDAEREAYKANPDADEDPPEDDADEGEGNTTDEAADDAAEEAPAADTAPADAQPATDDAEAQDEPQQAQAAPSTYAFTAPADIADKLAALKTEERAAFKQLMAGEMEPEDYQAIKDRTDAESDTLKAQKLKAELSAEMAEQQAQREWANNCSAFAAQVKANEGIDYLGNETLFNFFNEEVKRLARHPGNVNKPMEWQLKGVLEDAHKAVKEAMGLVVKAKPAAPTAPAAPRPQRPAANTIPPSLSKMPAAADPDVAADEFSHMRNLSGTALERAIAALSSEQLERYKND